MSTELPPVEALRAYSETELLSSMLDAQEKALLDVVHAGITEDIVAEAIRDSRAVFFADFPETYELTLFDDEIREGAAKICDALNDTLRFVTELPDSGTFARMSDSADGFSDEQAQAVERVWNGYDISRPHPAHMLDLPPTIDSDVVGILFSPFGVMQDESDVIANFGDPSGRYAKYEFQAIGLIGEQLGITDKDALVNALGKVDELIRAIRQYAAYRTLVSERPDPREYERAKDHFLFEASLDQVMRIMRTKEGRDTILSGSVYLDTDAEEPNDSEG